MGGGGGVLGLAKTFATGFWLPIFRESCGLYIQVG